MGSIWPDQKAFRDDRNLASGTVVCGFFCHDVCYHPRCFSISSKPAAPFIQRLDSFQPSYTPPILPLPRLEM